MKSVRRSLCQLAFAVSFVGSLSAHAASYPNSPTITISVSSEAVSTLTETAAEEHLVPNSQLLISGRGIGASNYFGLLGIIVDRSKNSSSVAGLEENLRLSFTEGLSQAMSERIAIRGADANRKLITDNAQVVLLPSAKLSVAGDGLASLSFRLTVRTGGETKNLFYVVNQPKPVAGDGSWSDGHSKAIREASALAFARLSDVLLDDMTGEFAGAIAAPKKTFVAYRASDGVHPYYAAFLFKEYGEYLAVGSCFGRRMGDFVTVLEHDSIAQGQDTSKLLLKCGSI